MTAMLAVLRQKEVQLKNKIEANIKTTILEEWHLCSTVMLGAQRHYEFQLKKLFLLKMKEGCLLSQIKQHKTIKADKMWQRNIKYEFLWFLKEFKYEQDAKRARRNYLLAQVRWIRVRNVFTELKLWQETRAKSRSIKDALKDNFTVNLKSKVLQALYRNIVMNHNLRRFEYLQTLRFKQEMFNFLRYSTQKQGMLRTALIETVEQRNIRKVEAFLSLWRQTTSKKIEFKESLMNRRYSFIFARVLHKIK